MKLLNITSFAMLVLALAACSSSENSSDTPSDTPSGNTSDIGDDDSSNDQPVVEKLATPVNQGELQFSDVLTVSLQSFLDEAGLRSVNAYPTLARDGKTVRIAVNDDTGATTAIASMNTSTGDLAWLATDLSPKTRIMFDANNNPVAAIGIACQPVVYTPLFNTAVMSINSVIAGSRCISVSPRVSANGNVLVFSTYDPQLGTEFLAPDQVQYAYTLDTANLVELPVTELNSNGINLSAKPLGRYNQERQLSDDGLHYLNKAWWEGTNETGDTVRQVGAVLWDTSTGALQTRGLNADLRGCNPTSKVSCVPPYSYVMSLDGSVQYSQVPTENLIEPANGSPFTTFSTFVEQTGIHSATPVTLPEIKDVIPVATNHDGSVLLLHALRASDAMPEGFNLYQPETNTHVSLNRALNACPETDDAGNPIDAADCEYTSVPVSITNDGESFTADGNGLILRSVSSHTSNFDQKVESFILDMDSGSLYSFPKNYSSNIERISADASVFLGQSNFPNYDLLIGKR